MVLLLVALTIVCVRLARTGFTGLGNPNLPVSVQGTHWQLTGIVTSGHTLTPAAEGASPATLTLHRHHFVFTGDCNDESGPLSVSGTRLTFRAERSTLVGCANTTYYTLLAGLVYGPAHYATAPGTLTLRSAQATFTFSAVQQQR